MCSADELHTVLIKFELKIVSRTGTLNLEYRAMAKMIDEA